MATDVGRARSGRSASPLGAAVARVRGPDGRPVGGAFLAAPGHLLTCAHVVNTALGEAAGSSARPTGPVTVDFPLLAPGTGLRAEIVHWVPPGTEAPEDLAGLRLTDPAPVAATPAALVAHGDTFDLRGVVLGFPALSDSGVWSIGRLRGRQAHGWVQIDVDGTSQFDIRKGFSGVPVWDAERTAAVGMIITAWRGSGIRSAYMVPAAELFAAWPQLRAMAQPPSPFPGLRSFTEAESGVFFGRDGLAARIAGMSRTAVLGPSGVGKSSLVRAGVLPRLREDPANLIVSMRPSEARTPLRSLALALDRSVAAEREPADRLDRVSALTDRIVREGLREAVAAVLETHRADRLLLFVDQLEEIFAQSDDRADAFGTALAEAAAPHSRLRLLSAVRADFLGSALNRPRLRFLVDDHRLVTVGELDDPELRRAITGPVEEIRSVAYEEGLVGRIMDEVGYAPGRLPLVQFTLAQLWERQENGLLTHRAYTEAGGVQHALARHAEQVWSGLDGPGRTAATRLLTQLVHPLPDRVSFTRRSAARADFDDDAWALAGRLATERVVVIRELEDAPRPGTALPESRTGTGGARLGVELAHESLITRWDRLGELACQYRDFRIWQDALRGRIDAWYTQGRPGHRLLPLSELREARRQMLAHPDDIGTDERAYLVLSRRRWRRIGLQSVAVVGALALLGGLQWSKQQDTISGTAAHSLAVASKELDVRDVYGSAQLALRAYRTDSTEETRGAVRNAETQLQSVDLVVPDGDTTRTENEVMNAENTVTDVPSRLSADGRTMVTTAPDMKPALWRIGADGTGVERVRLTGGDPLMLGGRPVLDTGGRHAAFIHSVGPAIGPDLPKNACSTPGSVTSVPTKPEFTTCLTVYDAVSGRAATVVPVSGIARTAEVSAMSFDPSGDVLALVISTGENRWSVQRRETAGGRLISERPLAVRGTGITGFWLSPGGHAATVLTRAPGTHRYTRHVLTRVDLDRPGGSPRVLAPLAVDASVGASADGTRIVAALAPSGDKDGTEYRVWDLHTGRQVARLTGFPSSLGAAHLSLDPTGRQVYATFPDYDLFKPPTSVPTDLQGQVEQRVDIVEAILKAATVRVWTWRIGENRLHRTAMRLTPGWLALRPLGTGADAPLALFGIGVIGIVHARDGVSPQERLGRPLRRTRDLDTDESAAHLCAALTTRTESDTVRGATPAGAARNLCG
ncbi:nSTAND1 domain-containing NTPase [Streptomyces sp. NBC_01217]|uniref:nSTAND1 domain-containing NTPase n=1 Tax=Streptomyces sp. NBC_01217 TaxID=2903779 RepID=UPI002E14F420|nr:trypsin-like peptidase domain-containing protein [Streptomyces sp. NBC_01217]